MSGSNTASLSGALKRDYGGNSKLFQQNLKAVSYGDCEKAPDKPAGEGFFHMTMIRGNESGGSINEDEALKDPQSPQPIQPTIIAKTHSWQFQVTGKAMAVMESDKYAFATATEINMNDAQQRCLSDKNRQYFGNGIGTLCQVNGAVVASNTVIVTNVQYLRNGMIVDFYDTVGGTKQAASRTISAINLATNTFTISGPPATISDLAIVVKEGVQDNAPADGKELGGLDRMIDTTTNGNTYQAIDRSAYPEYQSNVIAAGGVLTPLTQNLLQRLMNRIMIVGGSTPTRILSRHGVYGAWIGSSIVQSRYQDDKLKTGSVSVTWNGLEWKLDKDCQTNTLYMLNTDPQYLARYVVRDIELAEEDGKVLNKVPGFDKYYGYYVSYENLGTRKPNNHGKLTYLQELAF